MCFIWSYLSEFNIYFHRDQKGKEAEYEPISVISHQGNLTKSGKSNGHYTCYVRYHYNKEWFMTNESKDPVKIRSLDVLDMHM